MLSSIIVPGFVKGFLDSKPDKNIDFHFFAAPQSMSTDMIQGLKDRKYDVAFCSMLDHEPLIEFVPIARQNWSWSYRMDTA